MSHTELDDEIDKRIEVEAERDELLRDVARLQRELDNETLRRKSAESGMALLVADYNAVMTRLAHYEKVTS